MTSKKREYKMDKTVFKANTFEEAGNHYSYWKHKTLKERLEAACYLIISAYNFSFENPPTLDRNYFTTRKFKPCG